MSEQDDLYSIARRALDRAKRLDDETFSKPLSSLQSVAEEIGKSWSGSWLGYQSRVYYGGFEKPPAGARFSQEWGAIGTHWTPSTTGDWREYQFDDVVQYITKGAGDPDIKALDSTAQGTREFFEEAHSTFCLDCRTP